MTTLRYISGMSTAAVLAVALTACGGSSTHTASSVTKTASASTSSAVAPSTTASPTSTSSSTAAQAPSTAVPASSDAVVTQTVTKQAPKPTRAATASTASLPFATQSAAKFRNLGGQCPAVNSQPVAAASNVHCVFADQVAKQWYATATSGGNASVLYVQSPTNGLLRVTCSPAGGGASCTTPAGSWIAFGGL